MSSSTSKKNSAVYVSVDIETTGPSMWKHKVISLGIFVGDDAGKELETKKFNFKVAWPTIDTMTLNYGDFDQQCWDEFWSKRDVLYIQECKKDAHENDAGWIKVKEYLKQLDEKYGDDIVFVCDNPSFDLAFINYNVEYYEMLYENVHVKPIRYNSINGNYRTVMVSDDMFNMLPTQIKSDAIDRICAVVHHTHEPVEDAHVNYLQVIEALNWKQNIDPNGLLKK